MSALYGHLDAKVHSLAAHDAQTRIPFLGRDLFIEHDYSRYLSDVIDSLLAETRHGRMPCWLIVGDAGMGKTAQLHRFRRRYPDRREEGTGTLIRPVIIADVPPEPTRTTLEIAILEALEAPVFTHSQSVDRAGVIRRLLRAHQTQILVLDEIQHLCYSRPRDRGVVLDAIKALSTTCPMSVICAGTPAVVREFRADPQLERRFSITQYPRWSAGAPLQRFLATYESIRPLRLASNLSSVEMCQELLRESDGITHTLMQSLNAAACVAVHEGIERITRELISVHRSDPGRVLRARGAAGVPGSTRTGPLLNHVELKARPSARLPSLALEGNP